MPDFHPPGSNGSALLPSTPHTPVLLSNLIAFFLDSEASICQQSSALQTLAWAIVSQLAPPASNLPHKAAALVPNQVRHLFPLRC